MYIWRCCVDEVVLIAGDLMVYGGKFKCWKGFNIVIIRGWGHNKKGGHGAQGI